MILCIADVLNSVELSKIAELLNQAEFIDGRVTAGWNAKLVKNNTQLSKGSLQGRRVQDIITAALARNSLFQLAARPKIIHPVLVSRYEVGMSYGIHTDDAVMSTQQQLMRSDISFTLFLSPPEAYRGGELIIDSTEGERAYKLPAGAMILYPSSTLHRVETITMGIRLAAVGWIQSLIRDPQEREVLFDLETARQQIFQELGKTRSFDLLSKVYANLLRKWVDL
ncbi:Fe2+-dependent dioxygenase [Thermostichus vulcanus]|uniref:Fe2+-dependent dioxygenase n=1 Tax=Thermostichus vulcanus str. 'Rupite' TaxID=2813851 RepID=A0ABT0CFF5_THEVL|nr:Fe2+-dependent dioxygenase [Thermostichus vulcanus]MCJ2544517.1 Fe2+-dependent dioxygenase [Thermostichus vulcanus str. 'Rupite']